MSKCMSITCGREAQPEHDPCCSAHQHPLCCEHYCRRHFVQVHRCSPESHAAAAQRTEARRASQ